MKTTREEIAELVKTAREEIAELIDKAVRTGTNVDPNSAHYTLCLPSIVNVLLVRIERQANAIAELERRVGALNQRTRHLVRVG